ncbi:uncharacterized protein LOC127360838 [Dicentrarchus labrax]|uniref:uncharacterized protein LOC127360838 n=1 Tax=Dicentrarchus labrax TaxID=13489 RepID=UPI0021F53E4A|nr:uncharacterized protein LOC127360838 [Dicentrarchus labrax]
MVFAKLQFTASQQLLLRASGEAVAYIAAKGPRGAAAAARAKKPEEVEKEAQAHVVSTGGDPGNHMLVLSCHSIQFGKYQGQTFRWLLENDVGYTVQLVASREREKSASDSPLMANKDALAQYSCTHPEFAEHIRFHRAHEEARARASQPGCEGEALVGFGKFKEDTLKDLYESSDKDRQGGFEGGHCTLGLQWTPPGSTSWAETRSGRQRRQLRLLPPSTHQQPQHQQQRPHHHQQWPQQGRCFHRAVATQADRLQDRRRRPMGPGELQAKVRKLMTTPAQPAVRAVSTSFRDQRPSVPPPPHATEVTDEELVQMATDIETADVQVLQTLPLPLVVTPPSPPPPAPSEEVEMEEEGEECGAARSSHSCFGPPRPSYTQPPASPAAFFACRLFLWTPPASEDYRGPDDQPGYLAVVQLATALVGLRFEPALSEGRVDELIRLYEALSKFDRDRVVYPPRYRDRPARGRFKAAKPSRTSIPGVENMRRCLVGQTSGPASSPSASRLVEAVCIQLCRVCPSASPTRPPFAAGRRTSRRPSAACTAAAARTPLSTYKTEWLRRKKAEQRAAAPPGTGVSARAGVPQVQKCRKCGQPKRRETGHTRYGSGHFCSAAAGKSVEDWLREMKERDQGRDLD